MSIRCEDFPCCGHQLGECPTGPAKTCPDCGRLFEPTSMNTVYCLGCGSRPRLPKFDMGPMLTGKQVMAYEVGLFYQSKRSQKFKFQDRAEAVNFFEFKKTSVQQGLGPLWSVSFPAEVGMEPEQKVGVCAECQCKHHDGKPQPLYWAQYGKRHENLCQDCADEYGQAAADDAQDERLGDYD